MEPLRFQAWSLPTQLPQALTCVYFISSEWLVSRSFISFFQIILIPSIEPFFMVQLNLTMFPLNAICFLGCSIISGRGVGSKQKTKVKNKNLWSWSDRQGDCYEGTKHKTVSSSPQTRSFKGTLKKSWPDNFFGRPHLSGDDRENGFAESHFENQRSSQTQCKLLLFICLKNVTQKMFS